MTRRILRLELMWERRSALTRTLLVSSTLCFGLSFWMGVSQPLISQAAESVNADSTRATAYAVQLKRSLQAIEDGRQQAPRDRWDPQFIVDTVGISPAALYSYVRGNVGWVPYRGQLRGPIGTLMDRRANALDMSLLLAKLLTLAGHNVRLAHAELSEDTVDKVWQNLSDLTANPPGSAIPASSGTAPPVEAPPSEAPATQGVTEPPASKEQPADSGGSGSVFGDAGAASGSLFESAPATEAAPQSAEDAASLYEIDSNVAGKTLDAFADIHGSLADELQARVDSQSSRLLSYFNPSTAAQLAAENAAARTALADHWWVQVQSNGTWIDYDLLSTDGVPGTAIAAPSTTVAPSDLPPELKQRVQFKIVAEQLLDGKLHENTVLTTEFDPSQVIGKRIAVNNLPLLWPSDWNAITPDDVQEKLFAALYTQKEWMPSLTVGEEAVQQSSVLDTGAINPEPQPNSNPFLSLAFPAAGKVGRITDIFGQMLDENSGLGGGDEAPSEANAPKAAGELTAEWLEYTILVPGKEPIVSRRELFDLLGPALRRKGDYSSFRLTEAKRLERAAGEMTSTEIVILPCWPASEFLADLAAGLALANKPVLDEFTRDPFGKTPPNSVELFTKMTGMPASAYLYSMLRSEVSRIAGSAFVDRPQIVTQHGVLTRVTAGELTSSAAIDIVENGIGVDPFSDRDPFLVRLLQGIADTNAEALALPGTGDNVADFYDKSGADSKWTLLSPADKGDIAKLGLSPDYSARLMADLDAGQIVFSHGGTLEKGEPGGWWRIDPMTGQTLGMGARGWGQDLVEYAFQLAIQAMMAQIACMAFTAAAEDKISSLSAEEGRDKIKIWARNCVSQALLETISGLSTSWIQSRFLEGAKVPTWNQRAKQGTHITTSNNTPVHLPPTNTPHVNPPENTPHNEPRTTPPHDETTSTRTRTPPNDEANSNNQPRTNPPDDNVATNTNRQPKTETEDNATNTRKPPTTEDDASNTRKPPTTEDDASNTHKPPTTEDDASNTRKPPTTEDDTFDKKPWPTDDKRKTQKPPETEDNAPVKPPTPEENDARGPQSKPSEQPETAENTIKQQTQDAMDARKGEVEAAKKRYDDPTAENKKAYQGTSDESSAPNPAEAEAGAAAPSKPVLPEQEGPPSPPAKTGPNTGPVPQEAEGTSPKTQPMPNAPQRPGPDEDIGMAKTQAQPASPPQSPAPQEAEGTSPRTQPMANAPQRPGPDEDIGTAKTQAQPASPPQSPKPSGQPEIDKNVKAAREAEIEAHNEYYRNPSPENLKAYQDAVGKSRDLVASKVTQQTQDAMDARKAEVEALKKYYGHPTEENQKAYQEAVGRSEDAATREDNAWVRNGGTGAPPGTYNREPMPAPPKDWTPGKLVGNNETGAQSSVPGPAPAEAGPASSKPVLPEQEGPPSPPAKTGPNTGPAPQEAEGTSPTTQPMPNAPQRPAPGEDVGAAKSGNQSASNQTQPMPNAPQRPGPDEDIGTAKTKAQPSPPPTPSNDEILDKIRPQREARAAAQRAELEAEDALAQNKNPENKEMLEKRLDDAWNAYNKAHMAELNAWANAGGYRISPYPPKDVVSAPAPAEPMGPAEQEGPPSPRTTQPKANAPQPSAPGEDVGTAQSGNQSPLNKTQPLPGSPAERIQQQTQEAMDARKAEVEALKKYYGRPTEENQKAYQEAEQRSKDAAMREENAWARNGGAGAAPGTKNREPMPPAPKDWTPGKVISGEEPGAQSSGQEGPPSPTRAQLMANAPQQAAPGEDIGAAQSQAQPAQHQMLPEKIEAMKSYTDAAIAAHNQQVLAAKQMLANNTADTRVAYDQAMRAAGEARQAEAGAWYRIGGSGFPPSRSSGALEGMPEGLDKLPQTQSPVGPNATLAMGLGALTSTIQTGP